MGEDEKSCLSSKDQRFSGGSGMGHSSQSAAVFGGRRKCTRTGGARKSYNVSKKSLGGNKKRCPKYCRRKSVRCKSYRPVRKSRKPKSRKHR